MWTFIKNAFARWVRSDTLIEHDNGALVPVGITPEGKLYETLVENHCVVCGTDGLGFVAGATGGLSMNIQCVHCGYWYNVTPVIGIAQKIGYKDATRSEPWWPDL